MTNDGQDKLLTELRNALRAHYGSRLADLVLFGSRARGEEAPDSDYDVLVVLKGTVDPRQERRDIGDVVYKLCWEHDRVIACHFVPLARYHGEKSPFMSNVRREGVLV